MKTKIVYVLVSGPDDCYAEQLLMSLYSLRKNTHDAVVEVVIDRASYESLPESRKLFCKYADSVSVKDLPGGLTPVQRSRYLKTSLRQIVDGNFIYLDTDTIVCADISFIDDITFDLCAVPDLNRRMKFSRASGWCYKMATKLGLEQELRGEPYYNGGVIYSKDTKVSRLFFEEWHSCWKQCVKKGVNIDQLALCLANKKLGHVISQMDGAMNCQINSDGILYLSKAVIIHYFSNRYPQYLLSNSSIQKLVRQNGDIPEFVKSFIEDPRYVSAPPSALVTVKLKKCMGPLYKIFRYIKGYISSRHMD